MADSRGRYIAKLQRLGTGGLLALGLALNGRGERNIIKGLFSSCLSRFVIRIIFRVVFRIIFRVFFRIVVRIVVRFFWFLLWLLCLSRCLDGRLGRCFGGCGSSGLWLLGPLIGLRGDSTPELLMSRA